MSAKSSLVLSDSAGNSKPKPKYCLHFKRRSWCVASVKGAEASFGKTWFFNDTHGRDDRTDHLFCQQARYLQHAVGVLVSTYCLLAVLRSIGTTTCSTAGGGDGIGPGG